MVTFAVIVGIILVLIIWATIVSSIKNRRIRKALRKMAPELSDHIQADRHYNILLSQGKMLCNVKFIGLTKSIDPSNAYLPFPLSRWLIIEKPDGNKAFIKPEMVRYYEEAE